MNQYPIPKNTRTQHPPRTAGGRNSTGSMTLRRAIVGDPQADGGPNPELVEAYGPIRVTPLKNMSRGQAHASWTRFPHYDQGGTTDGASDSTFDDGDDSNDGAPDTVPSAPQAFNNQPVTAADQSSAPNSQPLGTAPDNDPESSAAQEYDSPSTVPTRHIPTEGDPPEALTQEERENQARWDEVMRKVNELQQMDRQFDAQLGPLDTNTTSSDSQQSSSNPDGSHPDAAGTGDSANGLTLDQALKNGNGTLSYQDIQKMNLTDDQSRQIISRFQGANSPMTPDKVRQDADFQPDRFGNSYNKFNEVGRLRGLYPGKSDDDIVALESARRNEERAKYFLFQQLGGTDKDRFRMLDALSTLASTATLPLDFPGLTRIATGLVPKLRTALQTPVGRVPMMSVETEAKAIMSSSKMQSLTDAFNSGKSANVIINGRPIQVVPDGNFSGFSNFRAGGFALGRQAFSSPEELRATVIHELYRLRNSAIYSSGATAGRVADETAAAAAAAKRATGR